MAKKISVNNPQTKKPIVRQIASKVITRKMKEAIKNCKIVGVNITQGRIAVDMKREELSLKAKIKLSTLEKYEQGKQMPPLDKGIRIADALVTTSKELNKGTTHHYYNDKK